MLLSLLLESLSLLFFRRSVLLRLGIAGRMGISSNSAAGFSAKDIPDCDISHEYIVVSLSKLCLHNCVTERWQNAALSPKHTSPEQSEINDCFLLAVPTEEKSGSGLSQLHKLLVIHIRRERERERDWGTEEKIARQKSRKRQRRTDSLTQ